MADSWLPTRSQGLETWQLLRVTGYEDEDFDQEDPWIVFDSVQRFVSDVVVQPHASSLLADYASYLSNYTNSGGTFISFNDEAAWESALAR